MRPPAGPTAKHARKQPAEVFEVEDDSDNEEMPMFETIKAGIEDIKPRVSSARKFTSKEVPTKTLVHIGKRAALFMGTSNGASIKVILNVSVLAATGKTAKSGVPDLAHDFSPDNVSLWFCL